MNRVIVLGSGVVALGAITEYAAAGISVIHVTGKRNDIASASKHISQRVLVSFSLDNSQALFELLTSNKDKWDGALIDPVNDPYVAFIAENHAALSKHYRLAVQPWEKINGIIEKHLLYQLAHRIGVSAPKIYHPEFSNSLEEESKHFEYPCIIKPSQTPAFFEVYGKKVLIANCRQELLAMYKKVVAHKLNVMVSEIISGDDTNLYLYICYRDNSGNILAEMCANKLRQHPKGFGVGSVVRSVPMIDEIKNSSIKLLDACGYSGMSATEFKKDDKENGQFKLIEINTRTVLYERLFSSAGINFREILFYDKVCNEQRVQTEYKIDTYWIHQFDDLYNLGLCLKKSGDSYRDFYKPYFKSPAFAVPFFGDRKPLFRLIKKAVIPMLKNKLKLRR